MSQPLIGQIIIFGGNFPPLGWASCNGQLLSIAQNSALFALIGTTYGGDGVNTFALPDLQSRVPISQGQGPGLQNYVMGQTGGLETVTLTINQIPAHAHTLACNTAVGNTTDPTNNYWAAQPALVQYAPPASTVLMKNTAIASSGGGLPHSNIIPYQAINYVIAVEGVFPSRN